MNVGSVQSLMGLTVVEVLDMPHDWSLLSTTDRVLFVGEYGHAKWTMTLLANRYAARRHLSRVLTEMAGRVGVEYTPDQRDEDPAGTHERN